MPIIYKYNRFSYLYDLMEIPVEFLWYSQWRNELFGNMSGRALEVGFRTGKNIRYYPKYCEIVAIDIKRRDACT